MKIGIGGAHERGKFLDKLRTRECLTGGKTEDLKGGIDGGV